MEACHWDFSRRRDWICWCKDLLSAVVAATSLAWLELVDSMGKKEMTGSQCQWCWEIERNAWPPTSCQRTQNCYCLSLMVLTSGVVMRKGGCQIQSSLSCQSLPLTYHQRGDPLEIGWNLLESGSKTTSENLNLQVCKKPSKYLTVSLNFQWSSLKFSHNSARRIHPT